LHLLTNFAAKVNLGHRKTTHATLQQVAHTKKTTYWCRKSSICVRFGVKTAGSSRFLSQLQQIPVILRPGKLTIVEGGADRFAPCRITTIESAIPARPCGPKPARRLPTVRKWCRSRLRAPGLRKKPPPPSRASSTDR